MIAASVSAALQVGFVLLIAAGAWLAARRREPFRRFVGLTGAPWRAVLIGLAAGVAVALAMTSIPAVQALGAGGRTVVGEAIRGGLTGEAAAVLAVKALVQTSLSEELLFRGLIGRNAIRRWGFSVGNAVQAILFGLVHLLLLSPAATAAGTALVVALAGCGGWVMGWMNERLAGGSILPGWAVHGGGNLTAYLALAFAA